MTEISLKAFELANNLAIQLITLSTAIVTLTSIIRPRRVRWPLALVWIFLFASVFCGVFHLMALTGALGHSEPGTIRPDNIYARKINQWAVPQVLLFLAGLAALVIYGFQSRTGGTELASLGTAIPPSDKTEQPGDASPRESSSPPPHIDELHPKRGKRHRRRSKALAAYRYLVSVFSSFSRRAARP